MIQDKIILAVITARGGSKGLRRQNHRIPEGAPSTVVKAPADS